MEIASPQLQPFQRILLGAVGLLPPVIIAVMSSSGWMLFGINSLCFVMLLGIIKVQSNYKQQVTNSFEQSQAYRRLTLVIEIMTPSLLWGIVLSLSLFALVHWKY